MRRDFRVVRACATEAVRDFGWHEYAPFGWILGAQLVFLVLAMNLGSAWGMATAGSVARLLRAEGQLHYPQFYAYLPMLASHVEAFLYVIAGSLLIPFALIRILAPMDHALAEGYGVGPRLKQAFLPTLVALVAGGALQYGWQWVVSQGAVPILRIALPGFKGVAAIWVVSVLGAFVIAAVLLYVPIAAIRPGAKFGEAISGGVKEGLRLLLFTLLFIFVFSLPALPFLMLVQLHATFLSAKLRPETIGVALGLHAVLNSAASYLIYASAARLHWAEQAEES